MYNIILITLLISIIVNYIKGDKIFITFNCGIWAYIGKDNKEFSQEKFNLLGLVNDSRGKDSSGIVYDDTVIHELKPYFETSQNKLIFSPKSSIILGHSRKASSGGKLIQFTQPFVWEIEKDGKKIIKGSLVHNGTLHNDFSLKKQYDIPNEISYNNIVFSPNDTQILAITLINNEDFSILKEYKGSAALIWENREKEEVYIFKGASKKFNKVEEERPLFIYEKNEYFWVSSEESALLMIADEENPNIYSVPDNELFVINKGKIIRTEKFDRSNNSQNYQNFGYSYGHSYNHYDEIYYEGETYNENNFPINDVAQRFNKEIDYTKNSSIYIIVASGRYFFKGKLMEGRYIVTRSGNIVDEKYYEWDSEHRVRYFKDGILINSKKDFEELKKLYKKTIDKKHIPLGCVKKTEIGIKLAKLLAQFSPYPVPVDSKYFPTFYSYDKSTNKVVLFDGVYYPLYYNRRYIVNSGYLDKIDYGNGYNYNNFPFTLVDEIPKKQSRVNLKKEENNILNNEVDENEEWISSYIREEVDGSFNIIAKKLDEIEESLLSYEGYKISKSAYKLVETLRNEILNSEFNLN